MSPMSTAFRKVGERILIQRRNYRTTPISATPPSEPHDLRLSVNQRRFDVSIHGYWCAILKSNSPFVSHLVNVQPTFADFTRAEQEINALDPVALEKLKLMWPSRGSKSTEDLMMHQFAKHALIAENNYKVNYFKKTLDVSTPFFLGDKDIRAFLRDNYAPGVKYNTHLVNTDIDYFVGTRTKIGYASYGPLTLDSISVLHDEFDQPIHHPDRNLAHQNPRPRDMIVVRR